MRLSCLCNNIMDAVEAPASTKTCIFFEVNTSVFGFVFLVWQDLLRLWGKGKCPLYFT